MSLSLTPLLVNESADRIPYMNIAWAVPAIMSFLLTASKVKVKNDTPFHNRPVVNAKTMYPHRQMPHLHLQVRVLKEMAKRAR